MGKIRWFSIATNVPFRLITLENQMKTYLKICLAFILVALSSIGFGATPKNITKSEHYEECKEYADRFAIYAAQYHEDGKVSQDKYFAFILDCLEEKERK